MRRFVFCVFSVLLSFVLHGQSVQRVVSLVPSLTDNIYLIGGEAKLVGCTSYCHRAIKDGVPQVGSAVNANTEAIFALQPDLVLASQLTKPQDVAALQKLGVQVEVFATPASFDDICRQTLKLARLLNREDAALEVVRDARQRVAEVREKSKQQVPRKVFLQIGANPVFAVTRQSFLNDYITFCNCINIAQDLQSGAISREAVLTQNPDVIIVAEMGNFGQQEKQQWQQYSSLSAVKSNRVFIISSDTSCNPSPSNFVSALEDVYRFIYSEQHAGSFHKTGN